MNVRAAALTVIEAALAAVEAERGLINDLNVYPVPDGDTGTNLALTVRAVVDELRQGDEDGVPAVAAAVTKGSLMGARGNSGVILSQIVRGVCDVWSASDLLGAHEFKAALAEGASAAYRAVKEPVEGTMLTVIREMAAAAQGVPDSFALDKVLVVVEEAGRVAVEKTTDQLPALQKAGVVDAGGYGLLVLLRGVAEGLARVAAGGAGVRGATLAPRAPGAPPVTLTQPSELSRYRYCTSLLIKGECVDRDAVEAFLGRIGDSALVVGDERLVKIHVHTDDPGVVLSEVLRYGAIGEVEINDMHEQTRARDDRLGAPPEAPATVVVAVVAGEGNKRLFRELGCHAIVDGGQSMNPSAAQLLEAVETLAADEVILLPNNGNVILTAEQAAGMSRRRIAVVPTTSMPAGLAAMVAFTADDDAVGNARAMENALRGLRSAEITHAVRDSEVDGVVVRKGQAIGLVDGRLVTVADDLETVYAGVVQAFAAADAEVVTVLTALNGSPTTAARLAEVAASVAPDLEVHIYEGGQPLYPILAGAE
ncbi:MAG TPA: DAK2 domain-containing protein [Thermoleophilia bacterium]|nr:DAK2 domain-containing protein [Thermoleophilia bacterium]